MRKRVASPQAARAVPVQGLAVLVTVVAKFGMLDAHGKVRTVEGTVEVRRPPDGSHTVPAPAAEESGRVTYDDEHDTLDIERTGTDLTIRFRGELQSYRRRRLIRCSGPAPWRRRARRRPARVSRTSFFAIGAERLDALFEPCRQGPPS